MEPIFDTFSSYSVSASGALKLTPNFTVREFACQDGSDMVVINNMCSAICQAVRNWFGYPFTPNSAYRTSTHNLKVGGAAKSNHLYGRAVDIPVGANVTPIELYNFLDRLLGNSCELGLYSWGCHVGIQSRKSRYTDSSYKGQK